MSLAMTRSATLDEVKSRLAGNVYSFVLDFE